MNQQIGLIRLIKAFGYSLAGLKAAWINEAAFRLEVLAELLNSAIEALADCISQEPHPLIKRAKDIGSAAVFIAMCYTVLVWGLVLWPF